MKKIFFNYSGQQDDVVMMTNLSLHFAVMKDRVSLWHKGKILAGEVIKDALDKNLEDSDAAVHLLSINYVAEDDCMELLQHSIEQHKKNIPVLLTSFDWQAEKTISALKDEFLPLDHEPVDTHRNFNVVYTEIVQTVRRDIFGDETAVKFDHRNHYWLLAGVVLVIGFFAALWMDNLFDSISIALLSFMLFGIAALFILRKTIFPTSVSTTKF
ncbi:MAG: TIR domain-containing protein [Ferruginibacter sp.]